MSSDKQILEVSRTDLPVVGIVGIVIALFGFKQGWDTGEVRPIMSWLIALASGYRLLWHALPRADLVCFPCALADDYSPPM